MFFKIRLVEIAVNISHKHFTSHLFIVLVDRFGSHSGFGIACYFCHKNIVDAIMPFCCHWSRHYGGLCAVDAAPYISQFLKIFHSSLIVASGHVECNGFVYCKLTRELCARIQPICNIHWQHLQFSVITKHYSSHAFVSIHSARGSQK